MSVVTVILGISAKPLVIKTNKGSKMENITVGSQFTTQKSGISGVVQEVIENKNGTFRVRLDVAGQPRWTTVKK
jgi:glycine betaine/choline ABC-type transport system substrate-binding protein